MKLLRIFFKITVCQTIDFLIFINKIILIFSIYIAEVVTILKTIDFIIHQKNNHHKYVILNDLLSTLKYLNNTENTSDIKKCIKEKSYIV